MASLSQQDGQGQPGVGQREDVPIRGSLFQSVADRDGALKSGMEEGVNDSHECLADLLETISQ